MNISDVIRQRILEARKSYNANDNISSFIMEGELDKLKEEIEAKVDLLLRSLVIDIDNDPNSKETPHRVAKMYVDEVMSGRYYNEPKITEFPNGRQLDQLYVVGPIQVNSMCSHHMVPILGEAWIGVFPGENVVGLSKFNRIVEWIFSRGQIQEEATSDLADYLESVIQPKGLAVYVKAKHLCLCWRGVKDSGTQMITSVMRGNMRGPLKAEFLSYIGK